MTMKTRRPKPIGCSKSSPNWEVYSNANRPQETRNISNKQPKLTPKAIRERKTKTPQSQQKEINHEDQIRKKGKRNEEKKSKDQ